MLFTRETLFRDLIPLYPTALFGVSTPSWDQLRGPESDASQSPEEGGDPEQNPNAAVQVDRKCL